VRLEAVERSDQTAALCSLQQPQESGLRLNANAMRIQGSGVSLHAPSNMASTQ